jgi:lipopolysaccharide heptosyltransferase III
MSSPISLPAKPRILVVTLRRLGDVLLATPLIRSLKRAWPDGIIDVLVFDGTAGIVEGNPDIDKIIAMPARPGPTDALVLMTALFKRYDLAVSTQPGDRPTFFTVLAGRRHAGIVDPGASVAGRAVKGFILHRSTPAATDIHRMEQVLRIADMLGIPRVPEVVCPAPAPLPFAPGNSYAVIHAAPMFRYKQWTPEGWRALAAGLDERCIDVVAIGGPDPAEREYLDRVWRGTVAVHQLSWAQNVALLQKARLYVGPDTSVSHLAAATGCSTVALFGPTDPRLWAPWPASGCDAPWQASATVQNRGNVWLVQNPLPCLPCQLEGCERNVSSVSVCLEELPAAQVFAAVDQALAKSGNNWR